MGRGGATDAVRQELARLPVQREDEAAAELGGLLRAAGSIRRRGSGTGVELATTTGAVARRAHRLLQVLGVHPTLWVRDATNVASRTYGVTIELSPAATAAGEGERVGEGDDDGEGEALGVRLGVLDAAGRPRATAPPPHVDHPASIVRGALLGAGSVSAPGRAPHLELRAAHRATAVQLADLVERLVGVRPGVGSTGTGARAVLKSGAVVTELLGGLGATAAYLAHDEQRMRRQVRGQAQRLANADAANVRRAVAAAAGQVAAVQRAVDALGWDGLPDDLREVALVRLANPAASLAELGELCDPPVGKSAVHRRLARVRALVPDPAPPASACTTTRSSTVHPRRPRD